MQPPWGRSQGQGSPHGHAAKASACSSLLIGKRHTTKASACSSLSWEEARSQGQGSPHRHAAKANTCSQGPRGTQPRPKRHAAKAKAAPNGHVAKASSPQWACCQG
nr:hypothetical protein CFP56_18110 [Quercus suber]